MPTLPDVIETETDPVRRAYLTERFEEFKKTLAEKDVPAGEAVIDRMYDEGYGEQVSGLIEFMTMQIVSESFAQAVLETMVEGLAFELGLCQCPICRVLR